MDNFIVSARKYRPATFVSVIGQSHITSTLKNAITRGQLAHAYLFCGPRGVGKTTCARIFAKAINCLDPKDGEACNECESCRAFNDGRSFNIHELDAASNNSVDDIRNLTDQVRIPPQIGRYSVYIIDEVHMLSLSAFNAFLKTLEEPPAHAVFILATTERHKIIPTILSRCQTYDFNRIRVEDGVAYLKYIAGEEGVTFDEESLHIIAQKADGGMRDALSMFDKVVSFSGKNLTGKSVAETLNVLDYDTYFTLSDLIVAGNYTEVLLRFDEILRKGFGGQTFIGGLNEHMRNLLMCKNPQTVPLLEVTGSVAQRYIAQAQQCSIPFLFEAVNLLTGLDAGFRTATNQRLHVELGLMKLCGMGQKKNLVPSSEVGETYPTPTLPLKEGATPAPTAPPVVASSPTAVQPQAQPNQTQTQTQPAPPTALPAESVAAIPAQATTTTQPIAAQPAASTQQPVTTVAQPTPVPPATTHPATPQVTSATPVTAPATSPVPQAVQAAAPSSPAASSPQASPALSEQQQQQQQQPKAPAPEAAASRPQNGSSPSLSGFSLRSVLQPEAAPSAQVEESVAATAAEEKPDERVQQKLSVACVQLAEELMAERPRLATAFNRTQVQLNKITLLLPNDSLQEEVERNMLELKKRLAVMGEISCPIEFEIRIEKDTSFAKPINPEDKLRFLLEQNDHLAEFKKALNLDID